VPRELAFLAGHGSLGGGEVMLLAMARVAHELGYAARVVAPDAPDALVLAARSLGLPVTALPVAALPEVAARARRPGYLAALAGWRAAHPASLVWANGLAPALAVAGSPRRVVHLHQTPQSTQQVRATRLAVVGARAVVVPSQAMAARIAPQLGRNAARLLVLPNWVDPVHVVPRPAEGSSDETAAVGAGRPLVLGFLGRIGPNKGVLELAEAVRRLDSADPGRVRLVLDGEPLHVGPAQAAAVERGLAPIAHLVERPGWLDRADFFARVDLAVFPSRLPESFGLVVAEAMSARVPFVISDAGALPEVAGPDHPWIARAGDPGDLTRVLDLALTEIEPVRPPKSSDWTTRHESGIGAILNASYKRFHDEFSPCAGAERFGRALKVLGD